MTIGYKYTYLNNYDQFNFASIDNQLISFKNE